MRYVDKIEIVVRSGKGGDGVVSFHRARNRPKLGPDGGNGGNGGDILFVGDRRHNTLSHLIYKKLYVAENGGKGGSQNKTGRCGDHLEVKVPLGTIIYNTETNEKLAEILQHQQVASVVKGGKRGYGNLSYTTSTRQAPNLCTQGEEATTINIRCELKLLADIGLMGFPNAGKSTLLSVISRAQPKIASYPFTTLYPHLGVVSPKDIDQIDSSFVVADLPGIIEGASNGKGLGHRFLKHLERCKVVVFVLDAYEHAESLYQNFMLLRNELQQYSENLANKKSIVVLNKADLISSAACKELVESLQSQSLKVYLISAVTKQGISSLIRGMQSLIRETIDQEESKAHSVVCGASMNLL